MTVRPRRSVLYMPGSNPRALEKARELPADVLILDLEDAVAPEATLVPRGEVRTRFTVLAEGGKSILEQNWTAIWAVPFALALLSTLAFALFFHETEIRKEPASREEAHV